MTYFESLFNWTRVKSFLWYLLALGVIGGAAAITGYIQSIPLNAIVVTVIVGILNQVTKAANNYVNSNDPVDPTNGTDTQG